MRYVVCVLFVLVLVTSIFPQPQFKQGEIAYIKPGSENIRLSPNGTILSSLSQGTKVAVLGQQGNWVAVQLVGWIWAPSLTKEVDKIQGFTLKALHILVKTEAEATDIKNRLNAGEDFSAIAKEKSIGPNAKKGGDLGLIQKGDLLPELDEALRKLKVGQISGVIKSDIGYHILKRMK